MGGCDLPDGESEVGDVEGSQTTHLYSFNLQKVHDDGLTVGSTLGLSEGILDGLNDGAFVGATEGRSLGAQISSSMYISFKPLQSILNSV